MTDEVEAIEARARAGYPEMRNLRNKLGLARRDIEFLVRAVRDSEKASRGFVDAICAGILVPDVDAAKEFRRFRESGGSIAAAPFGRSTRPAGGNGVEPPDLNKSGGSDVEGK